MRLLIILLLLYLGYRALKIWLRNNITIERQRKSRPAGEIDDVMVKDPVCNVYIPKRHAVSVEIDGEKLYFCSEKCKEEYLKTKKR
jgi:YHS domain-containing protein